MWIDAESFFQGTTVVTTLHFYPACLKDDGVILKLGRKEGDLTFEKDKSVSRLHLTLRLISNNDDDGTHAPRNDEERAAVEEYGSCVVLENMGKTGSFVAMRREPGAASIAEPPAAEESDDATDDEGISQPPKSQVHGASSRNIATADIPALSPAVVDHFGSASVDGGEVYLEKVDVGEQRILAFPESNTVLIQCGRLETTVRLTRKDPTFVLSKTTKAQQAKIQKLLPKLSGEVVDGDIPDRDTSYVVTPKRQGGAKQLAAWSWGIPIVAPSYLDALVERTSLQDPLPIVEDHLPTADGGPHWENKASCQLLRNLTLLSTEFSENERLAEAAGATVVKLYEMEEDDIAEAAKEHLQAGNFTLYSRKKACKSVSSLGVAVVTAKALAKTVSKQVAELADSKGKTIEPGMREPIPSPPPVDEPSKNQDGSDASKESDAKSLEETKTSKRGTPAQKRGSEEMAESPTTETQLDQETQFDTIPTPSRRKRQKATPPTQESEKTIGSADTVTVNTSVSRNGRNRSQGPLSTLEPIEEGSVDMPMESIEEESVFPTESIAEAKAPSDRKKPRKPKADSTSRTKLTNETHLAGMNQDGWFRVAPKDDAIRKAWRKRAANENAEKSGGVLSMPAAATLEVPVAGRQDDRRDKKSTSIQDTLPDDRLQPIPGLPRRQYRHGIPNFSRFRKNAYQTVERKHYVQLEKAKIKDSKDLRDMAEQERILEEEREKADELFRGDRATAKKTVRRRRQLA